MIKYTIPFYYLFHSRLKKKHEKISWFFLLVFPLLLFNYLYNEKFFLTNYSFLISQLVTFFLIYEIGYLYNDVITVNKEKEPNFRISKEEISRIKPDLPLIIIIRIILFVILILIQWNLYNKSVLIISFLVNTISFYLHNIIRSKLNIITYFLLAYSKYIFFFSLLFEIQSYNTYLTIGLIFPLIRTIEHSGKKKYNLTFPGILLKNKDIVRVVYYFLLLVVFYFTFGPGLNLMLVIYFFVFRSLTLLFSLLRLSTK